MFSSQDSLDFSPGLKEAASPVRKKGRGKAHGLEGVRMGNLGNLGMGMGIGMGMDTQNECSQSQNPFGLSQDSIPFSQTGFSQNFTERMGMLNMYGSQEYSNLSAADSSFCLPPSLVGGMGMGAGMGMGGGVVGGSVGGGGEGGGQGLSRTSTASSAWSQVARDAGGGGFTQSQALQRPVDVREETERPIDIAVPVRNPFIGFAPRPKSSSGVSAALTASALATANARAALWARRPHCEQYFQRADMLAQGNKMQRPAKVWVGAFKDRPRIVTEFEEMKSLGEGTFSTVLCVRHRLDGTLYAVKRLKEAISTERQGHLLVREANALAALQGCPQVVRYYGCWIDAHHLYLQTELCHLGSLEDLIAPRPAASSIMNVLSSSGVAYVYGAGNGGGGMGGSRHESNAERNRSDSFDSIDVQRELSNLVAEALQEETEEEQEAPNFGGGEGQGGAEEREGEMLAQSIYSMDTMDSNTDGINMNTDGEGGGGGNDISMGFPPPQQPTLSLPQPETRGICEDLAWLLLLDISHALGYMHQRHMAHLDLRPANVFLTCSPHYQSQPMDARDPQRIACMPEDFGAGMGTAGSGVGTGVGTGPGSMFSSIMSAAPLSSISRGGGRVKVEALGTKAGIDDASTGALGADTFTDTSTVGTMAGAGAGRLSFLQGGYEVRTEVERLLVERKYVLRVGDFGHCCLRHERGAMQEGETRYCARELINLEDLAQLDPRASDMFSLGASVYELCLGRFLGAEGEAGMLEWHRIRDGRLDPSLAQLYSPALVLTLTQLLHPSPAQRPTAAELVRELPIRYRGANAGTIFADISAPGSASNPRDSRDGDSMDSDSRCKYEDGSGVSSAARIEALVKENSRLKRKLAQTSAADA